MLVNKNTAVHVHSAYTTFDFNNVLVNVEILTKINKCCRSIVHVN